jgi:hypothetical protein
MTSTLAAFGSHERRPVNQYGALQDPQQAAKYRAELAAAQAPPWRAQDGLTQAGAAVMRYWLKPQQAAVATAGRVEPSEFRPHE